MRQASYCTRHDIYFYVECPGCYADTGGRGMSYESFRAEYDALCGRYGLSNARADYGRAITPPTFSRREQFAMAAMTGMTTSVYLGREDVSERLTGQMARNAALLADALIAELDKPKAGA